MGRALELNEYGIHQHEHDFVYQLEKGSTMFACIVQLNLCRALRSYDALLAE